MGGSTFGLLLSLQPDSHAHGVHYQQLPDGERFALFWASSLATMVDGDHAANGMTTVEGASHDPRQQLQARSSSNRNLVVGKGRSVDQVVPLRLGRPAG